MRPAQGGAAQRRRVGRLLRSIDVYVVFAVLGVIAYIIVVNLVAEALSMGVQQEMDTQLASIAATGPGAGGLPVEVYWPYKWPAEPVAQIHVLRDGRSFVESSLTRLAPLLMRRPALQLAVWDLLLLTGTKTSLTTSSAELRRVVAAVRAAAPSSRTVLDATRAAVESAAAVWAVRGMSAEVADAQQLLDELPPSPPLMALTPFPASSWDAFTAAVWTAVSSSSSSAGAVDLQEAYEKVRGAINGAEVSPLHHRRLMPFTAGTFDAVVPLPRLLLHLWMMGGRREEEWTVAAYDAAVEGIVHDLFHTRTVTRGGTAMNFTFVASAAEGVVPVATPRTCALAGVLAQGVRVGAHRYPTRPTNATYTEDNILQAAEALAASCFQQYVDPLGHHLRSAVYVTSSGPFAGVVASNESGASPARTTACDVPVLLLESFHELFLATHDPMYGLWSLLVMNGDIADHCVVSPQDLAADGPWLRYVRELRSLWLLLLRMDCLLYQRSRGTRGVCDVTSTTMVSPLTGHLWRLQPQRA